MGTKVEYSINVVAARRGSSSVECNTNKSSSSEGHRITGTNIYNFLQFPMERRMLERNIVESIKKTMQMHEHIFKHQVEELHRVYSVQKKLMEEVKRENRQRQLGDDQPDQRSREIRSSCEEEEEEEEEERETKRGRGIDLEIMAAEELGTSSTAELHEGEMEVDLTLSIGAGRSNEVKKKKKKLEISGLSSECCHRKVDLVSCGSLKSERVVGECSDPTTPMTSSSVTFQQETKQPQYNWLSQGLKLK